MYQETFNLSSAKARLHLSESPFPLTQTLLEIIAQEAVCSNLYPEPGSKTATEALAAHWGLGSEYVVISNGCDEAILNTFLKFGRSGDVIISSNSYPGYMEIADLAGQSMKEVLLTDLKQNTSKIIDSIDLETRLAILCNPHNPTGHLISIEEIDHFVKACNKKNVIPIVDEAYIDYSHSNASILPYIDQYEQIIVWKSFSKSHGLAGIRLGAAVGTPSLIAKLKDAAYCNPFSVNRISQRLVLEIIKDQSPFIENRNRVIETRENIQSELKKMKIWYNPSNANFIFLKAPNNLTGFDFYNKTGIFVRDCSSYGLDGYWRISCGTTEEMQLFIKALQNHIAQDVTN